MEQVPIKHLLEAKKIYYDDPFPLVVFKESDGVEACMKKLLGHKVLSAPVELQSKKYAFVDIADISYALTEATEEQQNILYGKQIGGLCNFSKRNEFHSVPYDGHLADLVKIFVNHGVRRIAVTDGDSLIGILSQMDVIRWLHKQPQILSSTLLNTSVSELMTNDPFAVKLSDKVFDTVKACIQHGIMGCAVLDGDSRIVANFSVSDLRGISVGNLHKVMNETVEKFLQEMKKFAKVPVCCKEKDSFDSAMKLMFQHHIHRVYVVDSAGKPMGVISTSDVMRLMQKK